MKRVTATKIRREISQCIDEVQGGEVVAITQYGRTVGYLISRRYYDELTGVELADLAEDLSCRPHDLTPFTHALSLERGPDEVVVEPGTSLAECVITREAAIAVTQRFIKAGSPRNPAPEQR